MYFCDICMYEWNLNAELCRCDKNEDEETGQRGYTTEFRMTSVQIKQPPILQR